MAQFIISVGKRKQIEEDYLAKQITFSCPANWYDHAIKNGNITIGDQRECVYAHISLNDPRIKETDNAGNPMGNNLTALIDERDKSVYLRHEPVLLTPAFCFYQANKNIDTINVKNIGMNVESVFLWI